MPTNLEQAQQCTKRAAEFDESFQRTNNYVHRDQALGELKKAALYAAVAQAEALWDIADTFGRMVDGE